MPTVGALGNLEGLRPAGRRRGSFGTTVASFRVGESRPTLRIIGCLAANRGVNPGGTAEGYVHEPVGIAAFTIITPDSRLTFVRV